MSNTRVFFVGMDVDKSKIVVSVLRDNETESMMEETLGALDQAVRSGRRSTAESARMGPI